jgi:hypothetical protein
MLYLSILNGYSEIFTYENDTRWEGKEKDIHISVLTIPGESRNAK